MNSIDTAYNPRPLQEWLHAKAKRFNVFVMHRRFGKTTYAVNECFDRALRNPLKNPQYAYLAPTYAQAKRVVWDLIKEIAQRVPGATINESDLRAELPRAGGDKVRIMLLGAENPGALRGIYLDGAILDEYSEMDPTVWSSVIRPALSDRIGWATFIGTPKGNNHFAKIYKYAEEEMKKENSEWRAALFKASETKVIPQKELDAAKAVMAPEEYEQEYECSFTAALLGAYYKAEFQQIENQKRIGKVPYHTGAPVTLGWDLGMDDSTAIWFMQKAGRENQIIDYMEVSSMALPEISRLIMNKGYVISNMYLPFDAAVREMGTGKTRHETLQELFGRSVRIDTIKRSAVADGINEVRKFLSTCWFDEDNCGRGIDSLKSYEREYNAKEGTYLLKPRHNWASHGADAFRTLVMGYRGDEESRYYGKDNLPGIADTEYDMWG